jgi:G8 domain/Right handed beta helix region
MWLDLGVKAVCANLRLKFLLAIGITSLLALASCGGGSDPIVSVPQQASNGNAASAVSAPLDTSNAVNAFASVGNPVMGSAANIVPQSNASLWSDKATWGGTKPVAGAAVIIPVGKQIILDEDTPLLGALTIEGELYFKQAATVQLNADVIYIQNTGALRAGTAVEPFTGLATITLRSTEIAASSTGMGTRGILISGGGKLELFGKPTSVPWTKLNAHADAGSTQLVLEKSVDWRAGDQIVIAPTEWYGNVWTTQAVQDASTATQKLVIASASGANIRTDVGVNAFRWGLMQYASDNGMSLTRTTFTKPHADVPDTLDERAEVGNLTRNIIIQAPDDAAWRNSGFGAHVMVMNLSSSLQMNGVELRRMGQQGIVGRYPIHWHLLSYAADGSFLGDAVNHFIKNSTISDSKHRCMVIHGTNGITLENNICYNIKGHAIFLEDAVEQRNIIEGNLVMRVRSPTDSLSTTAHEKAGHMCGATTAYWLTNPNNTVRNNVAADAQGNGFWLSYPERPVKQSKNVRIRPMNMAHGPFEFNTSHSNGNNGVMLECAMSDDLGNLMLLSYAPTTDGTALNYENGVVPVLKRITSTKNNGGYVNRVIKPSYEEWISADNLGRAFSGAVQEGSSLKHSLVIGKSLNDRQTYPSDADPQLGVASYHSQMNIVRNVFINFKNAGSLVSDGRGDVSSGVFGTDDYYIRPVEKGMFRNLGNKIIAADAGYRAKPPHLQTGYTPGTKNNWTLAGAIWDPHGNWAAAGRYWVLDSPFLRTADCVDIASKFPTGLANGLSCAGPYYGVTGFELNRGYPGATSQYSFMETIEATRLDASDNVVATWRVERGDISNFLGNMRHFSAIKGASYVVKFPEFPFGSATKLAPKWVDLQIENLFAAGDYFVLGVHYDGAITPSKVQLAPWGNTGPYAKIMTPVANKALVLSGDGSKYWRDPANNLIWVKITPHTGNFWDGVTAGSDDDLYRSQTLSIQP